MVDTNTYLEFDILYDIDPIGSNTANIADIMSHVAASRYPKLSTNSNIETLKIEHINSKNKLSPHYQISYFRCQSKQKKTRTKSRF